MANTRTAQERFQVADDNAQRRITVFSDDQALGTLLLGTAPSFKQVHIRKQSEDDVYALSFNAFEVVADPDRWLDTALVQPQGEISAITSADFTVAKTDGHWPAPDALPASAEVTATQAIAEADANEGAETGAEAEASTPVADDPAAQFNAESIAAAIKELRVLGLADNLADLDAPDEKGGADDDKKSLARFSVTISTDQGEYVYELLNKDANYYLRRNDYEQTFRVSKALYDEFARVRDRAAQSNS